MRYLLDTQLLLWLSFRSSRLPETARHILEVEDNICSFSVASIWEVSIKAAIGRLDFTVDPAVMRTGLLDHGFVELPVTGHHATSVASLPSRHGDPFDRMLLAQAIYEGMTLVTTDRVLADYGEPVLKV